jgi:GAF domain-containing protein
MASTTKKSEGMSKSTRRQTVSKKSPTKKTALIQSLRRELAETSEQQSATSDILRMIARAPADLQAVLDAIAERAARLCDAADALVWRVDNGARFLAAHFGCVPTLTERSTERIALDRTGPPGRAISDRQTVHVRDLSAAEADFPGAKGRGMAIGIRTTLVTPLLRDGMAIGAVQIRRTEVRPFSERQIKLLETFADQAVIAIENTRVLQTLEASLEQQTATGEVLRVIAGSPTELQPVLDTVIESAVKLAAAKQGHIRQYDGEFLQVVAYFNVDAERMAILQHEPVLPGRNTGPGRAFVERKAIHIPDISLDPTFRVPPFGARTVLAVPMLREGNPVGTISIWREDVMPFTERQIELVTTFADQAVIAIENVRLFNELEDRNRKLTEALEQQTVTSEILQVIAGSPTNIQPVLDTVAENAARLCNATDALIFRVDSEKLRRAAHFGSIPLPPNADTLALDRSTVAGRAVVDGQMLHIDDVAAVPESELPARPARQRGTRTMLAMPLLREGSAVGVILMRRDEVRPFSERQIALLKTFADQAVIAIENVRLFNELKESLEQQTATSEILRVIASSPTDIQPVLDAVAKNAARLCESYDAVIHRVDGDYMQRVAHFGPVPVAEGRRPITRGIPMGRALVDAQPIHVNDILAELQHDFPDTKELQQKTGTRTVLAVPLLREGIAIGVINVRRTEVRPFSEKQISLLKIFAAQAVIAIENVRLFKELGDRNAELREALEHQTATSEVLGIISRSPTDVQPVLDAIVESAARVCGIDDVVLRLREQDMMTVRAHFGFIPPGRAQISIDEAQYRWICANGALHVPDIPAQNEFPALGSVGYRTYLAVPLLQQRELIGVLAARRMQVRPFTSAQIKLLETFADQAVIALENVRLFQELKESLEQQTATSEILGVIASSPTDVQPVLDVVAENAARLCDATDAVIHRVDGEKLRPVANYGPLPGRGGQESIAIDRDHIPARAIIERQTLHIDDLAAVPEDDLPARFARSVGVRTVLATPLLREGMPIGTIHIRRLEVRPFTEKQIKLLETFADQAVIAIENVRLFQELEARNRDLTEALEQQTATSEILRVIASSPTDVGPVLDVVAESAARLCDALDGAIHLVDGQSVRPVAHYGPVPLGQAHRPLARGLPAGRAIIDRESVHILDLAAELETEFPDAKPLQQQVGARTVLATPLLREGAAIGAVLIRRMEVRPFTDKQIALLKTFADQAVIAIENVRLFRELKESLDQQTATSEILGVIASSPTEIQPVLDIVAKTAAQLCDASDAAIWRTDGDEYLLVASHGSIPVPRSEYRRPMVRSIPSGRAMIDREIVHIHDIMSPESQAEFSGAFRSGVVRTLLVAPLLREGLAIGAIHVRRPEVRPFTDKQIKLLETFADQAVIAIENVRLFKELQERNRDLTEALEQQTATSEILGVIASSPTDLAPVLATVAENAARLCEASSAQVFRSEGEVLRLAANYGQLIAGETRPISRGTVAGRAFVDGKTIHVADINVSAIEFPESKAATNEARLATPLLREGVAIGVIGIRRPDMRPFTESQIKLVETFAKQAVIAIENVRLFRELKESLEQQTATSEILGVIASSPTEIQPVLDIIAQNAAQLCGADDSVIRRVEGDSLRAAAHFGSIRLVTELGQLESIERGGFAGRAVQEARTLHVHDLMTTQVDFPGALEKGVALGVRTALAVPLLRDGNPIGLIHIRRLRVQPFTEREIKLVETFADQAVIAIENVRLFKELQDRNAELREALEHQTATSEVLGIISRSPTDVQPVLDSIVESAAKVCGIDDVLLRLRDGTKLISRAHLGSIEVEQIEVSIDARQFRWIQEHGTLHITDVRAQGDFPVLGSVTGWRTHLSVPLRQRGELIGILTARRTEVRPFSQAQMKLLETFADQAVIAIENVRLFQELKESLEQQTATSEILGVIASSPTDVQPVLDVVAENAARLCNALDAQIWRVVGDRVRLGAQYGSIPSARTEEGRPIVRGLAGGRAILDRETIHIPDAFAPSVQTEFPETWALTHEVNLRTLLATPLLREGMAIGYIIIRRVEAQPFSDKQIVLLKTFADQAVIAIENVRLFQELEARTRELAQSVGELRALGS